MRGYEIAPPDNELNGITFGGVGSGTKVEYIQVHDNADDGVEFFGGTVNAKYVVLTANKDDSVDWDNGYRGNLQYVLVNMLITMAKQTEQLKLIMTVQRLIKRLNLIQLLPI